MKRFIVFFVAGFLCAAARAYPADAPSPAVVDRQIRQEEEALRKLDQRYEAILREKMKLDDEIGRKGQTIASVASGDVERAPVGPAVRVNASRGTAEMQGQQAAVSEQEFLRAQKEKELRLADEERMRGRLAVDMARKEREANRLEALKRQEAAREEARAKIEAAEQERRAKREAAEQELRAKKEAAEQEKRAKSEALQREKEQKQMQKKMAEVSRQPGTMTKEQKQYAYFLRMRQLQAEKEQQSQQAMLELQRMESGAPEAGTAVPVQAAQPEAVVRKGAGRAGAVNGLMDTVEKADSFISDKLW